MSNAKFWTAITWLENMRPDWKVEADKIIQMPYAYCIHDKDLDKDGDERKPHVHWEIAYKNTTTYNNILSIMLEFSISPDKPCTNKVERVKDVRYMYDYLIHNTKDAQKKGKYLYPVSARVLGLNFDIGLYEQISVEDKRAIAIELSRSILSLRFTNYADFYNYVLNRYSAQYLDVVFSYSSHFERLCRGCYLKSQAEKDNSGT